MLIDLRHLLRNLRRSPASAAAAVLTLALTLGASSSIFAVVDAVLLTAPPFADPEALVIVGESRPGDPTAAPRAARLATFEAWRQRAGALARLEAYDAASLTLTQLGAAERVSATDVTPGFLAMLGVTPWRGRLFAPDDLDRPVVLVSHEFWRTKLGAAADAVGRALVLGGRAHTIVGVLPAGFSFALDRSDLWRPLQLPPARDGRGGFRVNAVARLAPGVPAGQLQAALAEVSGAATPPAGVVVTAIDRAIAGPAARTLGLLAGAAALALLIAFANLAGLLLVRSIDRRRELAVRSALGARSREIVRQLVLEAEALVLLGLVGGLLLAFWLTPLVARLAVDQFGAVANRPVTVSWTVLGGVILASLVCGVACGWLPAVIAARTSVVDVLRRGLTAAPRELGLRRLLVVGQVALACVLLVSLALVGRSLRRVLEVAPGFDPGGVLALQVALPSARHPTPDHVIGFYTSLQAALEARLGAGTVAVVSELPLTGDGGRVIVRPDPLDPGREAVARTASPGYFQVLRIPIVSGRAFDARDTTAAPRRVVVSRALADRLFPGQRAVGRAVRLPGTAAPAEIVGVAGDVKHRALDEELVPTVYLPAAQAPSRSSILVVRSGGRDAEVAAQVRHEVARLDGDLPVYRVRSLAAVVDSSPGVAARRVLTATFLGFAVLALALGGIGLFGVVSHDVTARRGELALRLALGADPRHILAIPVGQAAAMVAVGLGLGSLLSVVAGRLLGRLVFATGPLDPGNLGLAAGVLTAVAAIAVLPAAWRAARTDPMTALRGD